MIERIKYDEIFDQILQLIFILGKFSLLCFSTLIILFFKTFSILILYAGVAFQRHHIY